MLTDDDLQNAFDEGERAWAIASPAPKLADWPYCAVKQGARRMAWLNGFSLGGIKSAAGKRGH